MDDAVGRMSDGVVVYAKGDERCLQGVRSMGRCDKNISRTILGALILQSPSKVQCAHGIAGDVVRVVAMVTIMLCATNRS